MTNPTDLTAALKRCDKRAVEIERHVAQVPGYYPEAIQHAADLRTLTQALRAGAYRPIRSGGGVYICTQCDVEIPLSPPPVARPVSGEIADGDQTAELCGLIFDNVKASVDHIGDDAIAVLSDVTAAAEAILAAGFRRQASDSASPAADVEEGFRTPLRCTLACMDDMADWIERTKPQGVLYSACLPALREGARAIRESERMAALGRACERHALGWYEGDAMRFQPPADVIEEQALKRGYREGWNDREADLIAGVDRIVPLAAGQSITGKSEDGSSQQDTRCADPDDMCAKCNCWKLTREICS